MTPDVIVVGAGPAGATAALCLARAGVRVRLLDRARFPRDKLCGDTLNPGAMAIAERLGAAAAIRRQGLRLTGMTVTGPGAVVGTDYPRGHTGVSLSRCDLDAMLVEAAVRAGAHFDDGVMATDPVIASGTRRVQGVLVRRVGPGATRGHEQLSASFVIGAEGRRAGLAVALGLSRFAHSRKRWAFGARYAGVEGMTARGEMHLDARAYLGIAPLPGGLANVCAVQELPRGRAALSSTAVLDTAIARDARIRSRFAGSTRVSPVSTLGPLAVENEVPGCPGLLLAGDAAGFLDPMTGDGLRFALRGGELAAAAVLHEQATGEAAHLWLARERKHEFGAKWRLNRLLRGIAATPPALRVAAAVSACWSAPVRLLIGLAGDVPSAREAAASRLVLLQK